MAHLQAAMARCAHEGQTCLTASIREVVAQVQREYGAIHHDFRHEVDDALHTFVQTLAPSCQPSICVCPDVWPNHFVYSSLSAGLRHPPLTRAYGAWRARARGARPSLSILRKPKS